MEDVKNKAKAPINLARGWPNPSLLPVTEVVKASALSFTANPELRTAQSPLEYGPDEGYKPLRHSIATWLTEFYEPRAPIPASLLEYAAAPRIQVL